MPRTKQEREPLSWEIENAVFAKGYHAVCGCDEAGRGPLAGPVVAAAVILPAGLIIPGLNDSKKLSEKKRDALYDVIVTQAEAYAIAQATAEEIDEINILNASMLAMRRAVEALPKHHANITADFALIDGNVSRGFTIPTQTVVGGDAKSPSIAAASILAKVTRDRLCLEMDAAYPEYGFAKHKGYPTAAHMEAVRTFGPCPLHRRTFLKFL
ncbi:MAG: ribonuclease HII [Clostridia bacterium]|nr:ribonuclease HII [Clostridia bacterium]